MIKSFSRPQHSSVCTPSSSPMVPSGDPYQYLSKSRTVHSPISNISIPHRQVGKRKRGLCGINCRLIYQHPWKFLSRESSWRIESKRLFSRLPPSDTCSAYQHHQEKTDSYYNVSNVKWQPQQQRPDPKWGNFLLWRSCN